MGNTSYSLRKMTGVRANSHLVCLTVNGKGVWYNVKLDWSLCTGYPFYRRNRQAQCKSGSQGGRLLVNRVPMREQRAAKLTLNGVFDILKLVPLFTLSGQKVTLSNVVNYNAYSLILQPFVKFVKHIPFSYKNSIFPTLNDDSAVHCPARKKVPVLIDFWFTHRYTTD